MANHYHNKAHFKFNAQQIEAIVDRVVPLIAKPEDHEFFRGVLYVRAEASGSSADFSAFISKLLAADDSAS